MEALRERSSLVLSELGGGALCVLLIEWNGVGISVDQTNGTQRRGREEKSIENVAGNCEGPVLRPAYSLEGPEGDLSKGYA